ncbi:hypothetical protein Cme02nite_45120 [Catellatospora methionotrophica]|uniref:Uncharacterized protein n=1 Tax=Catellatospora methionotrophica TaxID=121620 RepID=A0A8J3LKH8_9ACTN|nr:hypothetical protein Cme02nite_45120 [Catellatospora methionotrophica]
MPLTCGNVTLIGGLKGLVRGVGPAFMTQSHTRYPPLRGESVASGPAVALMHIKFSFMRYMYASHGHANSPRITVCDTGAGPMRRAARISAAKGGNGSPASLPRTARDGCDPARVTLTHCIGCGASAGIGSG